MRDAVTADLTRRGKSALVLGGLVLLLSTLAYYVAGCVIGMNAGYDKSLFSLEDDQWTLGECFYAAAITVTTVGYGDVLGTEQCEVWVDLRGHHGWVSGTDQHAEDGFQPLGATLETDFTAFTQSLTAAQVIVGMAFFLYVIAQATTFFVEGGHGELIWQRRTRRLLARLEDHVIVCGCGEVGMQAVRRLRAAGVSCAVVDPDQSVLRAFRDEHPEVPCVHGDAVDEETLVTARGDTARALISLLPDDRLNLVTVVVARGTWPSLRIVCRGRGESSSRRLGTGGAHAVVGLDALFGLRAASELIRPSVVWFLDQITGRNAGEFPRLEGVQVGGAAGRTLAEAGLEESGGVRVIARRRAGRFIYNPPPEDVLADDDELALLGTPVALARAKAALDAQPARSLADAGLGAPDPDVTLESATGPVDDRPYIVCGSGPIARAIVCELQDARRCFVVIERDPEVVERLRAELPDATVIHGDAQDFETLQEAGVDTARGLVTALGVDRDNLVVVVTARLANPGLRVVAVAREERAEKRLAHAGASVVSAARLGGRRLATEVLHAHVTTFLDDMRMAGGSIRFEAVVVREGAPAARGTLGDLEANAGTTLRPVALLDPDGGRATVCPSAETRLQPGMRLMVVGSAPDVQALAALVGDWE